MLKNTLTVSSIDQGVLMCYVEQRRGRLMVEKMQTKFALTANVFHFCEHKIHIKYDSEINFTRRSLCDMIW